MKPLYRRYSEYLKEKYGEKTYKLPVNLPVSCPNRDGIISNGGCIFCGEDAAGFEMLNLNLSVEEQLVKNKSYIGKKYNAKAFIAYFQNFTNTYMPLEAFKERMEDACIDGVVEICVSTRPDCLDEDYLDALKDVSERKGVSVSIELGLQSVNYRTLGKLNRGHSLAEFIYCVGMIKPYGFDIGAHLILNLPWDDNEDALEAAKILSALKIQTVKLHSLYVLENTVMGELYSKNEFEICSMDEYVDRVVLFLEKLDPEIAVQRLLARAPKEKTLFCNWGASWWKIRDMIEKKMTENNSWQGKEFGYLANRSVERFAKNNR
jgi:hypothetical protein